MCVCVCVCEKWVGDCASFACECLILGKGLRRGRGRFLGMQEGGMGLRGSVGDGRVLRDDDGLSCVLAENWEGKIVVLLVACALLLLRQMVYWE